MNRVALALALFVGACCGLPATAQTRPNILWITAEDMSPTLGCYGDKYADTPAIDELAKSSLLYANAFATTPVCSPARACLINGVIATSQGAHAMRSSFPIPDQMLGFPALLRAEGYFTSNNVKTDYNSASAERIIKASWSENGDQAHWRHRKPGQPFFSVFNLMTSHQSRSMVWSYKQFREEVQSKLASNRIHAPSAAPLPPYYPDTPLVRKTVARFYDCVSVMDQQVGNLLSQLRADGLDESTVVFFYSDHGSGMPRHKRALLDSGMKVPLLVQFPKSMQPSGWRAGGRTDRLVCFEDFAATVLQLADVKAPGWMRGSSFLDSRQAARDYVHGHRDRVDEIWDLARSVRDQRYLYIRNYMPHLGYNQQSAWIDQGEIRKDFYALAASQHMTAAQRHFVSPTRPVEELYDCLADPDNLDNLVGDNGVAGGDHAEALARMRKVHRGQVLATRDLGFIPETELRKIANSMPPAQWATDNAEFLAEAFRAASSVGRGTEDEHVKLLSSPNASARYWGAMGLAAGGPLEKKGRRALRRALKDTSECVRTEAANGLARDRQARDGQTDEAFSVLATLLLHEDTTVILHAARTVELLGQRAAPLKRKMQAFFDHYEAEPRPPAWFIRFTTSGFLSRMPD